MKTKLILITFCLLCNFVFGQKLTKEMIIGKWQLYKLVADPELIYDMVSREASLELFIKARKKKKLDGIWTDDDILNAETDFNFFYPEMQKQFIEFLPSTELGKNCLRMTNLFSPTTEGKYFFDFQKKELILYNSKNYSIRDTLKIVQLNKSFITLTSKRFSLDSLTMISNMSKLILVKKDIANSAYV